MSESPETELARHDERLKALEANIVTKDVFRPVMLLVYGLTGILLSAVVGAIVAGVIK